MSTSAPPNSILRMVKVVGGHGNLTLHLYSAFAKAGGDARSGITNGACPSAAQRGGLCARKDLGHDT